ncbi:Adenosine deaminase-like protein [Psilocybe cubensis]|uniref:Adenosine deaminase domain-containing protein n=2 Tax=Psilocybe cubensis TaxID=181762 RepID=A0A8H7XN04_PSICU|nr:Adenosine deaminase-like protein [Psilocybe cubensis]KAH9481985.1 Adenosine deaminase-like protein [Psilocybe cubensis]
MSSIGGAAAVALGTLTPEQILFLQSVPKAELHAHLNGSIPIPTLQELASEYLEARASSNKSSDAEISDELVTQGIEKLMQGPVLDEIHDFFRLFPAIYTLTSTPEALGRATRAVLSFFLDGTLPQCNYLELRSTPRATKWMDREKYLLTVLDEMERYDVDKVGLIVSLDRRMGGDVVAECLKIACKLRQEGKRVVGIDLCGDPTAGDMEMFSPYFTEAKRFGLGLTLHIAETLQNTEEETLKLLSYDPDRLGHATFLNEEAISVVLEKKMCIEICLSSNLLCKTVTTLESHHILQYLKAGHPISICTDDILPFRTSLLAEYALLLAQPPYGLGLSQEQILRIGEMSLQARFQPPHNAIVKKKVAP